MPRNSLSQEKRGKEIFELFSAACQTRSNFGHLSSPEIAFSTDEISFLAEQKRRLNLGEKSGDSAGKESPFLRLAAPVDEVIDHGIASLSLSLSRWSKKASPSDKPDKENY